MERSSGAAELKVRMNRLYAQAGKPTYRELKAAADLSRLGLSTSSIGNLLAGKCWPRWDTVRAFVLVCKSRASTPVKAADLVEWRTWYDYWAERGVSLADDRDRGIELSAPPAEPTAVADIHAELESAIRRFADGPRSGGGYPFLLTPDVATVARHAKSRLDELSDSERAFLLTTGLFVGRGHGFGLYEFLPDPHASWTADSFTPLLASETYRTGRYRSAIVLQHMIFPGRDEMAHEALSRSYLRTWQQLSSAIRDRTVSAFIEDPEMCYDYGIWEAEKRNGLLFAAAGVKEIYSR
jgi:hypothetical protein